MLDMTSTRSATGPTGTTPPKTSRTAQDVCDLCDEVERLRSALQEIASPDCGRIMMSDGHYSIDGDAPQRIARRALEVE